MNTFRKALQILKEQLHPGPYIVPHPGPQDSLPRPIFGYRTRWKFILAKRYEIQIGCSNNGFNVRNPEKRNFMSSRGQLARKRGHRVQMSRQWLTQKPNLHLYPMITPVMNGQVDVFRTIVAALRKHKDLQLVLSVGDRVDPDQTGPAPKNAIIVKRAPQLELLKRSSSA